MKIGVVSDTHGSLVWWKRAHEYIQDVDVIVHCGDLFYHGAKNPIPDGYDTLGLAGALNELKPPLLIAQGNCDSAVDQLVLDYPINPGIVSLYTPKGLILAQHGDKCGPDKQRALLHKEGLLAFLSGHTHVSMIETAGNGFMMNPGSVSILLGKGFHGVGRIEISDEKARAMVMNIESGEVELEMFL